MTDRERNQQNEIEAKDAVILAYTQALSSMATAMDNLHAALGQLKDLPENQS